MSLVDEFRAAVADGRLSAAGNLLPGRIEAAAPGDVVELSSAGRAAQEAGRAAQEAGRAAQEAGRAAQEADRAAQEAGAAALGRGEVAVAVLGGGMATRFGGAVKATVPVLGDRTFLELKLRQAHRAGAPAAVMTSAATTEPIRTHVAGLGLPEPLLFEQGSALRLTPDGELFRDRDDAVSPYPTGHGDLFGAIVRSGVLDRLRTRGVRHLLISNLDNLLARPDPVVIGQHLLAGRPVTAEVVRPALGSGSGARVVRLDGRPVLLEASEIGARAEQLPPLPFSTNTFVVAVDAITEDLPLRWLYFTKEVDGRVAVQIERPMHHVTTARPTTFLAVPDNHFLPLKTRDDVTRNESLLRTELADVL